MMKDLNWPPEVEYLFPYALTWGIRVNGAIEKIPAIVADLNESERETLRHLARRSASGDLVLLHDWYCCLCGAERKTIPGRDALTLIYLLWELGRQGDSEFVSMELIPTSRLPLAKNFANVCKRLFSYFTTEYGFRMSPLSGRLRRNHVSWFRKDLRISVEFQSRGMQCNLDIYPAHFGLSLPWQRIDAIDIIQSRCGGWTVLKPPWYRLMTDAFAEYSLVQLAAAFRVHGKHVLSGQFRLSSTTLHELADAEDVRTVDSIAAMNQLYLADTFEKEKRQSISRSRIQDSIGVKSQGGHIDWVNTGSRDFCFMDLASMFPMWGHSISWSLVPGAFCLRSTQNGIGGCERNTFSESERFFEQILASTRINEDEKLIAVVDCGPDTGFITNIRTLQEAMPLFQELQTETFIIKLGEQWCINFTKDGNVYFGYSHEDRN